MVCIAAWLRPEFSRAVRVKPGGNFRMIRQLLDNLTTGAKFRSFPPRRRLVQRPLGDAPAASCLLPS